MSLLLTTVAVNKDIKSKNEKHVNTYFINIVRLFDVSKK